VCFHAIGARGGVDRREAALTVTKPGIAMLEKTLADALRGLFLAGRGSVSVVDRQAVQLLRNARDLVRRGWTQHAEGRDAHGAAVEPCHPTATSWSLLGALVAAVEELPDSGEELLLLRLADALDSLALFVDSDSLADWNDDPRRTQGDVIAVLETAAEVAAPRHLDA